MIFVSTKFIFQHRKNATIEEKEEEKEDERDKDIELKHFP
jgi:hypothetical protein